MRRDARGLTLIELMFVLAVIAVLIAMAVPTLLRSRIAANETACQAALKQFVTTEAVWRQTDSDRNAVQDYWTNDVAGLYAFTDATGSSLRFIDIALAQADSLGWPTYTAPPFALLGAPSDRGGYYYTVMTTDGIGMPYQLDPDGDGFGTSSTGFAFCGYPSMYGRTALRQYIVNEQGVVFAQDLGGAPPTTAWPAPDPTLFGWTAAE